jgi:hypothetical protein
MRGDADFSGILAWLEYSLSELDQAKRSTTDGVLLRKQQGAALAIAELVDWCRGTQKAVASALVNTRPG